MENALSPALKFPQTLARVQRLWRAIVILFKPVF